MIPSFEDLMFPMLKILSDQGVHSLSSISDQLANDFNVTEEERKELLPSGKYPVFRSRVSWAKTYMGKAGLLETPTKANYRITNLGIELMKSNIKKIDKSVLMNYPDFVKFVTPKGKENKSTVKEGKSEKIDSIEKPPLEQIEESYELLDSQLQKDIMDEIMNQSADFFEQLVVDLLIKMGYGGSRRDAGKAIGKSNDGGIDGTINEDRLGLDVIYMQAKRYTGTVPIGHVRDFAGALLGKRAKKGVFITTSSLPKSAYEYVNNIDHKIILIDGDRLTRLMIDFNVGISTEQVFEIKRVDTDYFADI